MSLPLSVLAEVCVFLDLRDVLSLSRTCKTTRNFFISQVSKPCWDAARFLKEIPDWTGVAAPQATAFLFHGDCQGSVCSNKATFEDFFICRRYCWDCAKINLLTATEVDEAFPHLHESLLERLPWVKYRTHSERKSSQSTRYYLKQDVVKLCKLADARSTHTSRSSLAALHEELLPAQRARTVATLGVQHWYRREIKIQRQRFAERWPKIRVLLQSRLGWEPVPYRKLSRNLKRLVSYLVDSPDFSEEAWNKLRGDLILVIKDDTQGQDKKPRPFSLTPRIIK